MKTDVKDFGRAHRIEKYWDKMLMKWQYTLKMCKNSDLQWVLKWLE